MSYLKPNTAGVYNIPSVDVSRQLYIRGKPFENYINELTGVDIFEQAEVDELKLLVQYLNTSGLSSEWIIDNNNKNQDLKTLITAIQTKLANIDTTALTETSVLNNDNRNSVLKTQLDTTDASLTTLTEHLAITDASLNTLKGRIDSDESGLATLNGKTRYITSNVGDNDSDPRLASYFNVNINDREKRSIYLSSGANFISLINDSTNQSTVGNYTDNNIYLAAQGGMITSIAHKNRIEGIDTIELTGFGGMGIQSSPNIYIGNKGAQIFIGSEDTPEIGSTNTLIQIGKRSLLKNTETQLRGNIKIGDARFDELSVSSSLSWTNLIALIPTSGLPLWVASAILTSAIPSFVYSDLWAMKGSVKDGDVETTNLPKLKSLTIYDPDISIDILPKVTTLLAKGDVSTTTLWGAIRQQVFNGEILLRNNNIISTNVDWFLTDSGDKVNQLKISNNDIELTAAAGAENSEIRISNATKGPIRFRAGTGTGLLADAHDAMKILTLETSTQVVIAGNNAPTGYDTTTKLIVDHQNLTNGIKVTNHDNALITRVNHNNINTPSLTLQSNIAGAARTIHLDNNDSLRYNSDKIHTGNLLTSNTGGAISVKALTIDTTVAYSGTTAKTLYVSDENLYFDGQKVATGTILSSGGGGAIYFMIIDNSLVISPLFTAPKYTIVSLYSSSPPRSIKFQNYQAGEVYNLFNHGFNFSTTTSPILNGLYEYNIYGNYIGNSDAYIYNEAHFIAKSDDGFVIEKTYTSPAGTGFLGPDQGAKTNEIGVNYFQYLWKIQSITFYSISYSGQFTLRCTLQDENEVVHYTFPDLNFYEPNGITADLTFDTGSIQSITAPFLTPCTRLRFKVTFISGTGFFTQASALNINNMSYKVNGHNGQASFTTPLYLGVNQKTQLTSNVGIKNYSDINIPITQYEVSHFRTGFIDFKLFVTQPAGNPANHSVEFWFGDGYLSHIHTTLATSPASTGTPTLSSVLNQGNSAGSQGINMNNNSITGINALVGNDGIQYVVKSVVAANPSGGVVVTNNGGGVVTIGMSGLERTAYASITQTVSQGGAFAINFPSTIDLRYYTVSIRLTMKFYQPTYFSDSYYTLFRAYINDDQSGYINKSLWQNTIHTDTDFASADNYPQSWLSPVFGYLRGANYFAEGQSLNSEMEISFGNTFSDDTAVIISNQFRTSVGQHLNGVLYTNLFQFQQQHGTIHTAGNSTNYQMSSLVIRQFGTVTRGYDARAVTWIKKRGTS